MKRSLVLIVGIFILSKIVFASSKPMYLSKKEETPRLTKSKARITMLKSVALPGWGEHSLDYDTRGYIFNGAELLGWLTYAAFTFYGQAKEKEMKAFASEYAQVSTEGKNDGYYVDIARYNSIYEYNNQMRRNGLIQSVYSTQEEKDENYWYWENEDKREEFDKIRYNSNRAFRNASLATTALIVNRVISVIDIMVLTSDNMGENAAGTPFRNLYADFTPGYQTQKISLNFKF